jgi:hypothetical protein
MAENEILDIGSSRRYKRWKEALTDAGLSAADIAATLPEDLMSMLRSKLRKKPLLLILQACRQDPNVLQDAIADFKEISLARYVQSAFEITKSVDPNVVAKKMTDLIVDGLINRSEIQIAREKFRLEQCKPELMKLLGSSLNGESPRQARARPRNRPSTQSVVSMSLRV